MVKPNNFQYGRISMRCITCNKSMKVSNWNHNKDKRQCAKCHYFGQPSAYLGQKKKTHCKNGHVLSLYTWSSGKTSRSCSVCNLMRNKEYRERK